MARKIQVFEDCTWHGYDVDFENNIYDKNKLFCYSPNLRKSGEFELIILCGHEGSAATIDDKEYCFGCRFYTEDQKRKKQFNNPISA